MKQITILGLLSVCALWTPLASAAPAHAAPSAKDWDQWRGHKILRCNLPGARDRDETQEYLDVLVNVGDPTDYALDFFTWAKGDWHDHGVYTVKKRARGESIVFTGTEIDQGYPAQLTLTDPELDGGRWTGKLEAVGKYPGAKKAFKLRFDCNLVPGMKEKL